VNDRPRTSVPVVAGILIGWLALVPHLRAADDKTTVEDRSAWSNVFGGQDVEFLYRVTAPKAFAGRLAWRFASDGRTLARGEVKVGAGPGRPALVKLPLTMPTVKDGIVLKGSLTIEVFAGDTPVASHGKALWVFPRDPFFGKTEWLKSLKLAVFDPEKKTAKVLTQHKISFEELGSIDSIPELKEGVLIIGEGLSLKDYPGLSETLVRASSRGLAVLCLAPSAGTVPIPGTKNAVLPPPHRLSLRRADVIRSLDKRIDAEAWATGNTVVTSLVIRGDEGAVQGEVDAGGWPWVEIAYGKPHGRLVFCGFGIMQAWDASPSPRFVFVRVLEHLTETSGAE
jgi:hypothetical protein